MSLTYTKSGVSIANAEAMQKMIAPLVRSTRVAGADAEIGGFGGLFDLGALNYRQPMLVAATDGVGTKLHVAVELNRHDTIGIDLVAMCVNDLIVQGAQPLFFLDYYATGRLNPNHGCSVVEGIVEGCRRANCALIGGETAELPGMYADRIYDLAGFAVGVVEREHLLPKANCQAGDVLLGLPSNGLHSNGFSLIRALLNELNLTLNSPFPFDSSHSIGEILLTPTEIYVSPVLKTLKSCGPHISSVAHITGGGLPDNLPRVIPDTLACCIDLESIELPPIYQWILQTGKLEQKELLHTFNCGVGMVLVVKPTQVDNVVKSFQAFNMSSKIIGHLIPKEHESVVFSSSFRIVSV